ncbi:MAG TPA: hypothetical protein VFV51_12600, partial [Vicinamibacterales bacterium]|nr:hypothetical protein [Vicinamibacterales bacterium]
MISADFSIDSRRFCHDAQIATTAVLVLICTATIAAGRDAQTIEVIGLDGKSVTVTPAMLERKTIVTEDRGLRTEFEGVGLREVLIKAGVPFGDA